MSSKLFSLTLAIRDIKIKSILRFNFAPLEWMDTTKQLTTNTEVGVGKREPLFTTARIANQ